MSENLDLIVKERAEKWLSDSYDEETRKKVKQLIDNDPKELTESFYKDLEFGTGGLRGIMGVGTNRSAWQSAMTAATTAAFSPNGWRTFSRPTASRFTCSTR